jgi:DNA-binding GntR family transcriptional regulator
MAPVTETGIRPGQREAGMTEPFGSLHLEHSSTVDRVAEELRRALFEGELEAGTPLREVALAESLGVSRPTVREALGVLVAEGLVTREPNRGVSVTSPDPDSVRDVCQARAVLELAGARHWPEADEADRKAVREALRAYEDAAADRASYELLNERHLGIHLSLVGLTGSPRLVAMAEALVGELRLALAQVDRDRKNAQAQVGSHASLVELLEGDRIEEAVAVLEHHLAGAEVAIIDRLHLEDP